MIESIGKTKITPMKYFSHTKDLSEGILSHGTKMGEGWLLTAEMMELVEIGYENIVCAQPFGCLPNHICGKGVMKKSNPFIRMPTSSRSIMIRRQQKSIRKTELN